MLAGVANQHRKGISGHLGGKRMKFLARSIGLAVALAVSVASPAAPAPRALEKDAGRAARTCWFAIMTSASEQPSADIIADGTWFLIEAARAEAGGGDPMARVQQIAAEKPDSAYFDEIVPNAADLKQQCSARWPKSVRASPVRMLKPGFERDLLCYSLASMVSGMADGEVKAKGSSMMTGIVSQIMAQSEKSLSDDELAKHGFSSQEQTNAALSRAVLQAQSLGNLNTVLSYCLLG